MPFLLSLWLASASLTWQNAPLRTVIDDIQQQTDLRFLYRDAIVADIRITLTTTEARLIPDLRQALSEQDIGMLHDPKSAQVVLYPLSNRGPTPSNRPLQGVVLDDATGARLPYATVMWAAGGTVRGVAADESGQFRVPVPPASGPIRIQVRYVGYRPEIVELTAEAWNHDLAVRLSPEPLTGQAVIIRQDRIDGLTDSLGTYVRPYGGYTGFSEPSALRTLQALPSVASNGAISTGLAIRGSKPDGFQVLLDGVPVYNHHHLFGLFDPFNPDALQTVGVHTGITPAVYPGPPGGTLSYLTKAAPLRGGSGSVGMSSSAIRGTIGVPLWTDRASLLIAGRLSYLNQVDWFGNGTLIHWGLNVDRPTSEPAIKTVFPESAEARFHDLHAKATIESADGSRWIIAYYNGGDDTRTDASRYVQPAPGNLIRFDTRDVSTRNAWGSTSLHVGHQSRLGPMDRLHLSAAFASYHASFEKDDFLYVRYNAVQNRWLPTYNRFAQDNDLREWRLNAQWDRILSATWLLRSGLTGSWMDIAYTEESLQRPNYGLETRSAQIDLYTQLDGRPADWLDLSGGLRTHVVTLGGHMGWSPRLLATLNPDGRYRMTGGWSVNHQHTHSVSVKLQSSADVWIGSTSEQPPSRSDHWTLGWQAEPLTWLVLQLDLYRKTARDVRLHEVNPSLLLTRESPLEAPWFARNRMRSSGLEVLLTGWHRHVDWMTAYTWSRSEFENPSLNNGSPFPTDWDRRHQGSLILTLKPAAGLTLTSGLTLSSGAPNTATAFSADEPERLAPTGRLDAGIGYVVRADAAEIGFRLSVYNLTDRDNVWYRTPVAVTDRSMRPPQILFRNLDVYDLGRHISVDMRVGW